MMDKVRNPITPSALQSMVCACTVIKQREFVFLLTENGISEFFTDGIIHC